MGRIGAALAGATTGTVPATPPLPIAAAVPQRAASALGGEPGALGTVVLEDPDAFPAGAQARAAQDAVDRARRELGALARELYCQLLRPQAVRVVVPASFIVRVVERYRRTCGALSAWTEPPTAGGRYLAQPTEADQTDPGRPCTRSAWPGSADFRASRRSGSRRCAIWIDSAAPRQRHRPRR